MGLEIVVCPSCKQKLALQEYVIAGVEVVCAECETALRIEQRHPVRVTVVPYKQTLDADSRPESYG